MKFFDNFFSDGPWTKFKRISPIVADWWNSIQDHAVGETIVQEIKATVILCPSPEAMRLEYKVRSGMDLDKAAGGVKWEQDGKTFILLPYKETQAGNMIVDLWAISHEVLHLVLGRDIDDVDKPEFYDV